MINYNLEKYIIFFIPSDDQFGDDGNPQLRLLFKNAIMRP